MDIDKELKELFDDPLLNLTQHEAALFNIPADMKRVMRQDAYSQTIMHRKRRVRTSTFMSRCLRRYTRN